MVVFTCNHCGDSVHKPKVEKHYQFACRAPKSLTCVDCFKDFKGEEYDVHTKCMTEEERYAAKGTHPNGIVKKGEVKQESWVEMIKSILDREPNMKPSHKNLMQTISKYSNIPRKKVKFVNFIRSSSGGRVDMKEVEEVWDIIEKYKNDQAQNNVSKETDAKKESNEILKRKGESENHSEIPKKKKKKLKQDILDKSEENTSSEINNEAKGETENDSEIPKKKKKKLNQDILDKSEENTSSEKNNEADNVSKKRKQITSNLEETVQGKQNGIEGQVDNIIPKKKKKKQKDSLIENVETMQYNQQNGTNEEHASNGVPKKKKKQHEHSVDKIETAQKSKANGSEKYTDITVSKKKKKQKEKNKQNGNDEEHANDEIKGSASEQPTTKFCFAEKILEILSAKQSISLKKLQKKVLNDYLEWSGTTECTSKAVRKFKKKLKKVPNVSITEEIVTLLETNK